MTGIDFLVRSGLVEGISLCNAVSCSVAFDVVVRLLGGRASAGTRTGLGREVDELVFLLFGRGVGVEVGFDVLHNDEKFGSLDVRCEDANEDTVVLGDVAEEPDEMKKTPGSLSLSSERSKAASSSLSCPRRSSDSLFRSVLRRFLFMCDRMSLYAFDAPSAQTRQPATCYEKRDPRDIGSRRRAKRSSHRPRLDQVVCLGLLFHLSLLARATTGRS